MHLPSVSVRKMPTGEQALRERNLSSLLSSSLETKARSAVKRADCKAVVAWLAATESRSFSSSLGKSGRLEATTTMPIEVCIPSPAVCRRSSGFPEGENNETGGETCFFLLYGRHR